VFCKISLANGVALRTQPVPAPSNTEQSSR
jgi:hypothetical protein